MDIFRKRFHHIKFS